MADESAALDALYKGANALVDVQAKLSKDGVDEYAEVISRTQLPRECSSQTKHTQGCISLRVDLYARLSRSLR
eukprot:2014952-Rhodomonas_salina.2